MERYHFIFDESVLREGDVILFQCERFVISFSNGLYYICSVHLYGDDESLENKHDIYPISEDECGMIMKESSLGILLLTLLSNDVDRNLFSLTGPGLVEGAYGLECINGDWSISHLVGAEPVPILSCITFDEAFSAMLQLVEIKLSLSDTEVLNSLSELNITL